MARALEVPARQKEDAGQWMRKVTRLCQEDHKKRSPWCKSVKFNEIKIPYKGGRLGVV